MLNVTLATFTIAYDLDNTRCCSYEL